jgi:transcriptional regulator with XRE-family HTH domain
MDLGTTIKNLRKSKGYTQSEFAKLCDITQTSLSLIESNNNRPNSNTLKNICITLQVPESYIYLLSIDEADIPKSKLKLFKKLFPPVKDMLKNLLLDQ